jgi:hypothetical protein
VIPDIAHKLSQELTQTITSERQVVYILVELRKLLEKKGLLKEERFRALRFCCDWTVHSKLDRDTANIITELFDHYESMCRQEPIGVSQAGIPELVEFCEHSRFRQQLITACQTVDIATDTISNDDWWRVFWLSFQKLSEIFGLKRSHAPPSTCNGSQPLRLIRSRLAFSTSSSPSSGCGSAMTGTLPAL